MNQPATVFLQLQPVLIKSSQYIWKYLLLEQLP